MSELVITVCKHGIDLTTQDCKLCNKEKGQVFGDEWDTALLRREADTLERLGRAKQFDTPYGKAETMTYGLCAEGMRLSADAIEELQQQVESLRKALDTIASKAAIEAFADRNSAFKWIQETAEAAIKDPVSL